MLEECRLHRVQRVSVRQPLDRDDLVAVVRDGEREARVDAPAVDEDRARAALPVVSLPRRVSGECHGNRM